MLAVIGWPRSPKPLASFEAISWTTLRSRWFVDKDPSSEPLSEHSLSLSFRSRWFVDQGSLSLSLCSRRLKKQDVARGHLLKKIPWASHFARGEWLTFSAFFRDFSLKPLASLEVICWQIYLRPLDMFAVIGWPRFPQPLASLEAIGWQTSLKPFPSLEVSCWLFSLFLWFFYLQLPLLASMLTFL